MKKRELFSFRSSLFRPLWILFFTITPNSASGDFLNVSCSVEVENISMKFSYTYITICLAF